MSQEEEQEEEEYEDWLLDDLEGEQTTIDGPEDIEVEEEMSAIDEMDDELAEALEARADSDETETSEEESENEDEDNPPEEETEESPDEEETVEKKEEQEENADREQEEEKDQDESKNEEQQEEQEEDEEQEESSGETTKSNDNSESSMSNDWFASLSPADRVQGLLHVSEEPLSVVTVQERADVTDEELEGALEELPNSLIERNDDGVAHSSEYRLFNHLRELCENGDEELSQRLYELAEEEREWRNQYEVSSPKELRRTISGRLSGEEREDRVDVSNEWKQNLYEQSLVRAALMLHEELDSLEHYEGQQ